MTGYSDIRKMSDEELAIYFKRFAKYYFWKGCRAEGSGDFGKDSIDIQLSREIGLHSNNV